VHLRDVVVVKQREFLTRLLHHRVQPLLYVNFYLVHCQIEVRDHHLVLRDVDVEVSKLILNRLNRFFEVFFFVVELNEVVLFDVTHESLDLALEGIHDFPELVLLAQHLLPHLVQGVIIHLEDPFHLLLVAVELVHDELALGDVRVPQLDHFLLDLPAYLREDNIVMAVVDRLAQLAEERLIQHATELDLLIPMLLAVELLRHVGEVLNGIDELLLLLLALVPGLELLEGLYHLPLLRPNHRLMLDGVC